MRAKGFARKTSNQSKSTKSSLVVETCGFDAYQQCACETIHGPSGQRGQIASMLGLASETGSILDCYKRYLRDSIDLSANREFLREELGDLLWYIAAVATACGLTIREVAEANLLRTRRLYPLLQVPRKSRSEASMDAGTPTVTARSRIAHDFADYQGQASTTSQLNLRGPEGPIAPMFGLASATGSILDFPKNNSRNINLGGHKKFFLHGLGDLLWYTSAVATSCNLDLGEIADRNLQRAHDLYTRPSESFAELIQSLPNFDDPKRPTECLPRLMIIRFEEHDVTGAPAVATQTLIDARPLAFPRGPIKIGNSKKLQGFELGAAVGQAIDDNTRRSDGYRYHDAIHFGFAAVLGWSPTIRTLLRVKRRSKMQTDRDEDGARANFTEEGLAAILSRLAPRRMGFLGENTVDGEVITMAKGAVHDLEAQVLPGWLWRRAISQGFNAMRQLEQNRGGYLKADLDQRELAYSKTTPVV